MELVLLRMRPIELNPMRLPQAPRPAQLFVVGPQLVDPRQYFALSELYHDFASLSPLFLALWGWRWRGEARLIHQLVLRNWRRLLKVDSTYRRAILIGKVRHKIALIHDSCRRGRFYNKLAPIHRNLLTPRVLALKAQHQRIANHLPIILASNKLNNFITIIPVELNPFNLRRFLHKYTTHNLLLFYWNQSA